MANCTKCYSFHQVFGAVGYVVIGVPTGVCNLAVALSIAKYKALTDCKEMVILMALALADAFNVFGFAASGVYRLLAILSGAQNDLVTSAACLRLPHLWLWSFSHPLSSQMLVVVSADRLLLVTMRHNYITQLGLGYAWGVVGGLYMFNILFALVAISLALVYGYKTPALRSLCYYSEVFGSETYLGPVYQLYTKYTSSLFPLISVFVFALTAPIHRYRQNRVDIKRNKGLSRKMKMQNKLTKSIAISSVCTLLLACIPSRLAHVFKDGNYMLLSRVCWFLVIANPLCNCFIYHWCHRNIRTAMHGLFSCKIMPDNIDLWTAPGNNKRKIQAKDIEL